MSKAQENLSTIGSASGAIIGSIIPGAGTALGALIGGASGTIIGAVVDHINWLKSRKKPISGKDIYQKYKANITKSDLAQIKNNISKISSDPIFFTTVAYAIQQGYFNSKTPYMKDFWQLWFKDVMDFSFPKITKQERKSVIRLYNASTGANVSVDYLPTNLEYLREQGNGELDFSEKQKIDNTGIFVPTKSDDSPLFDIPKSKETSRKSKSFIAFLIDLITK